MKLLTKKLLENAQGDYLAQMGLTWQEGKVLRDLVQSDLNRRRNEGPKDTDYQILMNVIGPLHEAVNHLNYSYDKRQEGRYIKATDNQRLSESSGEHKTLRKLAQTKGGHNINT